MDATDELEEDILDGDTTGSYDRLQGRDSKIDTKIAKFEGDRHDEIGNDKTLTSAVERSETDSDTTYPSRRPPIEIGSERLQMRNCPFFYIPDNLYKKKIAQVRSKIGSRDNINHSAGGGNKKIFSQAIDVSSVTSRIDSGKRNTYPTAIPVKSIRNTSAKVNASKQDFKTATQVHSRIGSLENINHIPGGGDKKIQTYRTPDYKHKVSSKCDSSDPTPSVHQLRSNIDELVCDEVIHYHSRYKHTGRPNSAPAKHERSLHTFPNSGSNISRHSSLGRSQNLNMKGHVTEPSSDNTSREND